MKRNLNRVAPTKRQILVACIFVLQVTSLVNAQTSNEPYESTESSSVMTRDAFISTTDSSQDEITCPHCNMNEVSLACESTKFLDNFAKSLEKLSGW